MSCVPWAVVSCRRGRLIMPRTRRPSRLSKKLPHASGGDPGKASARQTARAVVAGRGAGWSVDRDHKSLALRGTRPLAPKDLRTASAYVYGAIHPAEGQGAAQVLPRCNTEGTTLHVAEISAAVTPRAQAILLFEAGYDSERARRDTWTDKT